MFSTEAFKAWAKKNVILLEVDFPRNTPIADKQKKHNEAVKAKFSSHVRGYPTILFVDANEKVVGKSGYRPGGPDPWIKDADKQIK